MDNKIKIGIPRGLYYYKYNILWKEFFKELGCDIIVSPETNFETLENGKKYSASEMCLSLKIYIGHVFYLKDKVDYVLVPTSKTLDDNNFCPYYLRIYDIVNNTFDINILNYNINEFDKKYEEDEFIKIGEKLGFSKNYILTVYHKAKMEEYKQNKIEYLVQDKKLKRDKIKVIINKKTITTNKYKRLEELPNEYTSAESEKDGCIVVKDNVINIAGSTLINNFMENPKNEKYIRIATYEDNEEFLTIYDVQYIDNEYILYIDYTRSKSSVSKGITYIGKFHNIDKKEITNGLNMIYLEDIFNKTIPIIIYK